MGEPHVIPFNRPATAGNELSLMADAIARGHISGDGFYTKAAEEAIEAIVHAEKTLLTTSCTHALELSARVLDLGPDDDVIVPAYTFVSTASAFALAGARPLFVDVNPRTLNLDVDMVERSITPRTRAICTVHYAGIADGIERLRELAEASDITLIEDNAHGFGASSQGKALGSFGAMSTLSFHETKNVTCGEGGALCLNENSLVHRAEILREKGTNRKQFFRGQVDKYTWLEPGSSWVPSDLLAAYLCGQLEAFPRIQTRRMEIWQAYAEALTDWTARIGAQPPYVPEGSQHVAHMYFLRMASLEQRTRFIQHMRDNGVMAVFHYQALNTSPAGLELGGRAGQCPVAENASETLVRLPLFADLRDNEFDRVVEAALSFKG